MSTYRAYSFTADPGPADDETKGFRLGSRWINTTTNRGFQCTRADPGNAMWIHSTVPSARLELLAVPFSTNSATYVDVASIPLMGANEISLTSIKIVASNDGPNNSHTFDCRVVDEDNANAVIAELNGASGQSKQILDLGPLTNLPTSNHVLTLQLRRSGNTTNNFPARLHSVQLEHL